MLYLCPSTLQFVGIFLRCSLPSALLLSKRTGLGVAAREDISLFTAEMLSPVLLIGSMWREHLPPQQESHIKLIRIMGN